MNLLTDQNYNNPIYYRLLRKTFFLEYFDYNCLIKRLVKIYANWQVSFFLKIPKTQNRIVKHDFEFSGLTFSGLIFLCKPENIQKYEGLEKTV